MIRISSRENRHIKKFRRITSSLNIVSLMDIFTILLLFLLIHVSAGEGEIPIPEILRLPLSTSNVRPEPTLTIYVTEHDILVENDPVVTVKETLKSQKKFIAPLEKKLSRLQEEKENSIKKIMIMGDRSIPFILLKKVMETCSKSGYSDITLAVIEKE